MKSLGLRLLRHMRACTWGALGLLTLGQGLHAKALDLKGYSDASGAITVQYQGDTVDPYFVLQALLLAQSQQLDISAYALPWARWLAEHDVASGHLGRYCKTPQRWIWCKAPDADDSSLALWLQFLRQLPASDRAQIQAPALEARAHQALAQLKNPANGLYQVTPHIATSLFMDNLEVWASAPDARLAQAIQSVFWDTQLQLYRISTQAEHPHPGNSFYPDATAQIFPLLLGYPLVPGGASAHYQRWMKQHRARWLAQMGREFPWGLIAMAAQQQGDSTTVRCWQQHALPFRHSHYWTVTDEVVAQILPPLKPPYPNKKDCT